MEECYGKLLIVGKDGSADLEFPLDKKSVLIGRDLGCDIRIVNKEISRRHAELFVNDKTGAVHIRSTGREPISVNAKPALAAMELKTGDRIEVHLEGRTRTFYFHGNDETVQLDSRAPLGQRNAFRAAAPQPALPTKPARAGRSPAKAKASRAGASARDPQSTDLRANLQQSLTAEVNLRKVDPSVRHPPSKPFNGAFAPNLAELFKAKAGLRKAGAKEEPREEEEQALLQVQQPEAVPKPEAVMSLAEEEQQETGASVPTLSTITEEGSAEDKLVECPEEALPPTEQAVAGEEDVEMVSQDEEERAPLVDGTDVIIYADEPMQEALDAAAGLDAPATVPAPAAAIATFSVPGSTAGKVRKSVRFDAAAGTPEGAARDATMTIRLRRGDLEQVINVDDSTVALAEWALGTMAGEEEELPATVVSHRSRRHSGATPAPGSTHRTPIPAVLQTLFAEAAAVRMTPLASVAKPGTGVGITPAAAGARAPAPTPNTAARPSGPGLDSTSLAAKLAELAEGHEITLEVPADLMRSTPATAGRKSFSVVMTPKSAARSVPRTAGRSRLAQATGAVADEGEAAAGEVEQPVQAAPPPLADTPLPAAAAAASVRKSSQRRSISRTPGTKIAIISRRTPRSSDPASVRQPSRRSGPPPTVEQSRARALDSAAGEGRRIDLGEEVDCPTTEEDSVGGAVATGAASTLAAHSCPSLKQRAASAVAEEQGGEADEEDGESAGELEGNGESAQDRAAAAAAAVGEKQGVSLSEYRRAVMQAKMHCGHSRKLASQLRGVSARAARLRRAAAVLAAALEEERSRREELQAAMQQMVSNSAEEAEQELLQEEGPGDASQLEEQDAEEGMDVDGPQQGEVSAVQDAPRVVQPRVVVVGYSAPPHVERTQRAGCVVVVRPAPPAAAAAARTPATARKSTLKGRGRTPATVAKPATTAPRSARKTPGSVGGAVVLNQVEVPGWVFEEPQAEAPSVKKLAAELAVVAAAPAAEAQEEAVLEEIRAAEQEALLVQEKAEAEEKVEAAGAEEAEEDDDLCHVCGYGDEGDVLLLCDACDNACHLACCAPALKRVPKGDWFCKECVERREAEVEPAAKKAPAKRGTKRAAAAPAAAPSAKAPARGRKAAPAPTPSPTPGTKRTRGGAAPAAETAAVEDNPKPKRTRATAPAPAKEAPAPRGRARARS